MKLGEISTPPNWIPEWKSWRYKSNLLVQKTERTLIIPYIPEMWKWRKYYTVD